MTDDVCPMEMQPPNCTDWVRLKGYTTNYWKKERLRITHHSQIETNHLATGHFFANEHFVAIVPDFATKVALKRVFFIGELRSPMKNIPFSGGFSRPIRLK